MNESQEVDDSVELQGVLAFNPKEFVDLCTSFPCFSDARLDSPAEELFTLILTAYRDDNLTEEQDLVVELLFHLSDENSPFNLKRASEVWAAEDLEAFWYVIAPEELEQEQ